MVKKIATVLVSILIIAIPAFFLVRYYIANFYDDPGAVSAREQRVTNEEVKSLIGEYSKLEKGDAVVICVNPAFGGYDHGASDDELMEKDITLDVALKLDELAKNNGNIKLYLTRYGDTAPKLGQRVEIIEALQPDIVIDLCVSEDSNSDVMGIESFFSSAYYDYRLDNGKLADIMERNLVTVAEAKALGVRELSLDENYVVAHTRMSSCRISMGYISSDIEKEAFRSEKYIETLAKGLMEGILEAADKLKGDTSD